MTSTNHEFQRWERSAYQRKYGWIFCCHNHRWTSLCTAHPEQSSQSFPPLTFTLSKTNQSSWIVFEIHVSFQCHTESTHLPITHFISLNCSTVRKLQEHNNITKLFQLTKSTNYNGHFRLNRFPMPNKKHSPVISPQGGLEIRGAQNFQSCETKLQSFTKCNWMTSSRFFKQDWSSFRTKNPERGAL